MCTAVRKTARAIALVALSSVLAAGCVSPKRAQRVAEAQAEASAALAESYATDLAAMRALTAALLDVRRESLRSRLERAVARRYITPSGEADLKALDADLQDASARTPAGAQPLIAAVNNEKMTAEQARAWLKDYALAWRMDAGDEARRRLVRQLPPMRDQQKTRDAMFDRLDAHAQRVRRLVEDALASARALERFTSMQTELTEPSRRSLARLWRGRALENAETPERRRLLADFFETLFPDAQTQSENKENPDDDQ